MTAVTMPLLLNAKETAARLGLSERTFHRLAKLGQFRVLKVSRPVGQRCYSREKVEQYARGDSMSTYGRRHA